VSVSTNTLTVVRGVGGTSAAAMNNDDELYIIGVAQPEGDTSRPSRSSNPTKLTNYTQIQREPFDITGTAMSSLNATSPHDWDYQEKKHGIEQAKNVELTGLLGGSGEDTSGSQPRRTTKGVIPAITTNVTDAAGALSETEFQTFQRSLARYGNRNRTLFASALVLGVLNNFAQGKLQVRQGENTYGLAVTTYVSPFGTLDTIYHPLLEGAVYGGYAHRARHERAELRVPRWRTRAVPATTTSGRTSRRTTVTAARTSSWSSAASSSALRRSTVNS
jgi:hypothetical protein